MNTELSSKYDPSAVEAQAYQVWLDEKCFHANPTAPGDPFTIVIPPPNVTGALHLGHAINNTLQDILTRMHRMAGFNTLWVPGIDHAGIATQAVVEKQLKEKENKTRHDVGREGLIERIWAWKQQYGDRILSQLKRLGCSCDWDRTRFTLDDMCARAVRETFFKLFKDGLIYRGKRLVNWDTFLQTSISDDEIYHETVKTNLWHIRYPIEGTDRQMIVATTRPETMLADTAVAVHSEDPRWNWAIGKSVKLPLTGRLVPIIADDILVDPKFGTGVVKVTPAHDPNDYAVWQRHKDRADQIDILNLLTPDGRINSDRPEWSQYSGMKRDAARKKVVEDLQAQGLLEKEEPYETQVGHSDRSKTPIEPYLSDQWFVKMAPLAEPALEVVRQGIIKFFPERYAQTYLAWLGEKRDWPISRQLWWGHRIPVWTSIIADDAGGRAEDLTADGKLSPRLQMTLELHIRFFEACGVKTEVALAPASDAIQSWIKICLTSTKAENAIKLINSCYSHESSDAGFSPDALRLAEEIAGIIEAPYTQDPDVLDTWFSSALWPHSTLGWPEQTPELSKYYPTSVLVTGRDIITLWVARMVMTGIYNMGHGQFLADSDAEANQKISNLKSEISKSIPFHHVAINPTILDGKGERMSKSKGNGVDPVDIIDAYGADALRFTLTKMATETQDARMPVKKDAQGRNTSEKFDEGRNFCNKLWNACRFALQNLEGIDPEPADEQKWSLADRWIVSRFNRAVDETNKALESYRFDVYAKTCYDFFWRDFCDWYVEAIKPALKDPARRGQTATVLASVIDGSLRLMHPMIPFITETVWWRLNDVRPARGLPGRMECPPSKRLVLAKWPIVGDFSEASEHIFPKLQEIISAIRNLRNEHQVNPKQSVNVSIRAGAEPARQIETNREMIEMLATCQLTNVAADIPPAKDAATITAAGCEIFVEGLVNADAERHRLTKSIDDCNKKINAINGRLANEAYIAKAPPALVQQSRDQLANLEAELTKLQEAMKKL